MQETPKQYHDGYSPPIIAPYFHFFASRNAYVATINTNLEAVKLLIKHGADVNLPTKFGSPLHAAAQRGCLACAKLLVEAGADVNALTPERKPAIHLAKKFGFSDVVDYLLRHG